jgi:pyruvate,orthophosphate dikinase
MLETVLDVGLNATTVDGILRLTGNPRLAWDSYRRFVQNYAKVVAGLAAAPFQVLVTQEVTRKGAKSERELDYRDLRAITLAMLERYEELAGAPVPSEPMEQLLQAVLAVFRSWDAPKAVTYRRLNRLSDSAGTAVTVQMMVFGNFGPRSGAGVGFTRDPATGARELYFDFCLKGQGEDVVSGRHTPMDSEHLRQLLPAVFVELQAVGSRLEAEFRDVQDFEFYCRRGTRSGRRGQPCASLSTWSRRGSLRQRKRSSGWLMSTSVLLCERGLHCRYRSP